MTEEKPLAPNKLHSPTFWVFVVLMTGLVVRLLTILLYQPVAYSDTPSYRRLAEAVRGGFVLYDGTRTPGYPVFLAVVGSDRNVWLVQLMMGLVTTLLLYYIGWKLTGQPWLGGIVGLAHTLNLGQLFFESNLLTETLTTFLLTLVAAGVLIWVSRPGKRNIWLAFGLALVSTIALLVRPLFIFLPFFALIFLYLSSRLADRRVYPINHEHAGEDSSPPSLSQFRWMLALVFLLPVILLLGGWVTFIHAKFGDWSLTTMTGYHLIQHTGSYFEYVPDEYAELRDTYIRYRDAQVAQYGSQANTIWEAIPEMSQVSGYNFYDLSRVLAKISMDLILEHPLLFIQNALQGWWMFWRTSVYWSAEALRFPALASVINPTVLIQRGILFVSNLAFIGASLYFMLTELLACIRHKAGWQRLQFDKPAHKAYFWFLTGNIWLASILQTLLDHGDNPRFLVPLQSLVGLWVVLFFFEWAQNRRLSLRHGAAPG
jgi:hypothetical protein